MPCRCDSSKFWHVFKDVRKNVSLAVELSRLGLRRHSHYSSGKSNILIGSALLVADRLKERFGISFFTCISLCFNVIMGLDTRNPDLLLANNNGADQPAHPCSLVSAFVIRYLKSEVTRSGISLILHFIWWASA